MPEKIFYGERHSKAWDGEFYYQGKGEYAKIALVDADKVRHKATLTAYTLKELQKLPVFQDAREAMNDEVLVNNWLTRHSKGVLIKYSSKDQLALVFESKDGADFSLLPVDLIPGVDYFNECRFINVLARYDLSLGLLRSNYALSEERIQLLSKQVEGFEALLQHGARIEQIAALSIRVLQKQLHYSHLLPKVLTLCRIEQLMGVNHRPPAIELPPIDEFNSIKPKEAAALDASFFYSHKKDSFTVTYLYNRSRFQIDFNRCDTHEKISTFRRKFHQLPDETFIRTWHTLSTVESITNTRATMRSCADNSCFIIETCDARFPKTKAAELTEFFAKQFPYYKERYFASFLTKNHSSLQHLSRQPGMTQQKLEILCNHVQELPLLLARGLTLEDFAKVDAQWLSYILSNKDAMQAALHFVDAFELLGLRTFASKNAFRIFSPATSSTLCDDKSARIDYTHDFHDYREDNATTRIR